MADRIGVLGGTFNPVHVGHLLAAQDAVDRFGLSGVLFVPCSIPPHKQGEPILEVFHRLAMLHAALEGDPRFALSTVESEREGVSYTIDTAAALQAQYPAARLYFIIGLDTLYELPTWHRIEDLLPLAEFVTLGRPGVPDGSSDPRRLALPAPWPERLAANVFWGHAADIASRDIRRRVREGRSIRYLVPPAVETYIRVHDLYKESEVSSSKD